MTLQQSCRHRIVQVVGYADWGATVGCLRCDLNFGLPAENMERYYYPFAYTSPEGKDDDIHILVHRRIVRR